MAAEIMATRKEFREFLNAQDTGEVKHKHNRYQQRTRPYGDYLYFQDREKFEADYQEWLSAAPAQTTEGGK